MILTAFFKALGQIGDRRFNRVLLLGIALTLGLLVGATVVFVGVMQMLFGDGITLPLIGEIAWAANVLSVAGIALMLVLSVFLMVPVASAITSMFLDQVAAAVEDRHYPDLPPAESVSLMDALRDTLAFLGVLITANLAALVLYIFFAPLALFIFWGLNGFLLGREYFTLVAMRRIGRQGARTMRRAHAGTIWLGGILMAVPLSVPLLNLLVPILGAATFTHIFHALQSGGNES